ncbi:MAG: cbb3-type cytochrome c oxidase subunit I [Sideroxyarcus sp.]|nr:cbb3-type cytochrome c oxidase subunit I [Sideroxyarcus sp.]
MVLLNEQAEAGNNGVSGAEGQVVRGFTLTIPSEASRRLAAGWLKLGIASLVGAGVFAILLVLSRTPYVQDVFPWVDFFHAALVVHVDLSVLLWFMAFAGVLWSLNSSPQFLRSGWLALILAWVGAVAIVLSPFVDVGKPLMSNYVPVIQSTFFFTGLIIFTVGVAVLVLRSLVAVPSFEHWRGGEGSLRVGFYSASITTLFALAAFVWSYVLIPDSYDSTQYYDLVFWGGGHVLQFTYLLLMLAGWLWLADACGAQIPLSPRVASGFLLLGLVPVFYVPVIYLSFVGMMGDYVEQFTQLMKVGGAFAPVPLGLAVLVGVLSVKGAAATNPYRATLFCSIALFAFGAGISLLIQDSNTIITAHYHGTGGAISLAFMGLTLYLLQRLGYREPNLKWATLVPYVYGAGQLLHILGLLWSGGYGVQRKVAGAAQELHGFAQTAGMGLMGLGGLIAVIGGIMFLVVVFKSMRRAG